jgi:hypothetical protein
VILSATHRNRFEPAHHLTVAEYGEPLYEFTTNIRRDKLACLHSIGQTWIRQNGCLATWIWRQLQWVALRSSAPGFLSLRESTTHLKFGYKLRET